MFEITIKGETLEELLGNLEAATKTLLLGEAPAPKSRSRKAATTPTAADVSGAAAQSLTADEDEDGDADLNAPADPMPEGADAVVDAGTGKPLAKPKGKTGGDEPIKMTMDDVKTAAAKLVAKDQAKLVAILQKYKAANLSAVPKEQLGDFAADVMEALEA